MSSKNTASLFDVLDAVSHDLKSPLASILSVIALIRLKKEKITSKELDEYLARAEEKALFLNENIDALFATGAILEKKLELQKRPIDLQKLFERLQYSFKDFDFPVIEDLVSVIGDEEWLTKALSTIFQHLNRLKEQQSKVVLRVKTSKNIAELEIVYKGEALNVESFELISFLPQVTKAVRLSLYVAVEVIKKLDGTIVNAVTKNSKIVTIRLAQAPSFQDN